MIEIVIVIVSAALDVLVPFWLLVRELCLLLVLSLSLCEGGCLMMRPKMMVLQFACHAC